VTISCYASFTDVLAEDISVAPENAACLEAVEQLVIIGTEVAELECLMCQPVPGQNLSTRGLRLRNRLRHIVAKEHLPSEISLAEAEDLMKREDSWQTVPPTQHKILILSVGLE
jgi:hypothetical protein